MYVSFLENRFLIYFRSWKGEIIRLKKQCSHNFRSKLCAFPRSWHTTLMTSKAKPRVEWVLLKPAKKAYHALTTTVYCWKDDWTISRELDPCLHRWIRIQCRNLASPKNKGPPTIRWDRSAFSFVAV